MPEYGFSLTHILAYFTHCRALNFAGHVTDFKNKNIRRLNFDEREVFTLFLKEIYFLKKETC